MNAFKAVVGLLIVAVLGAGGLGYQLWQTGQEHEKEVVALKAESTQKLQAKAEEMESKLNAQAEQHQQALQTLNAEHEKKLDELRAAQRVQLSSAYKEFENIFEGNKQTIDYINLLETKVKSGQALSKTETEKLAVIAAGLGYLKKQYAKPLQEFTELETYFAKQAGMQPEKPKGGFFRRVFSREFKDAEKEYYKNEGMRMAFEQAQGQFSTVYASAQKAMASVDLNADEYVKKLYAVIEEKDQANKEDLAGFFDKARQALRTHQDVLKFEPDNLPPSTAPRP